MVEIVEFVCGFGWRIEVMKLIFCNLVFYGKTIQFIYWFLLFFSLSLLNLNWTHQKLTILITLESYPVHPICTKLHLKIREHIIQTDETISTESSTKCKTRIYNWANFRLFFQQTETEKSESNSFELSSIFNFLIYRMWNVRRKREREIIIFTFQWPQISLPIMGL